MATSQDCFDNDTLGADTEVPLTRRGRFSRCLRQRIPAFIVTILLLLLLLILLWSRIFVVIPAGYCGTLFSVFTGTVTDRIYREGSHIICPFNTMAIYEMRQQLMSSEYKFLTAKGLEMKFQVETRFAPEFDELPLLHREVGPDYVRRVLTPEIAFTLHQEMGMYTAEEIVNNKDDILHNAVSAAIKNMDLRHIRIDNITISRIQIPATLKSAIEDKLAQEQTSASYEFRQAIAEKESKRLQTEAIGMRERNNILAKSLDERLLRHDQIEAMRDLAKSPNAKTVIMASGVDGKSPVIITQ